MAKLSAREQTRLVLEADLEAFIRVIHKDRALGQCHIDLIRWMTREDAKSHQLILLPRDHQKSALIAYRAAWEITRNPAVRILYISSTSTLAKKQLKMIKDILTCDTYRYYWPEMVNPDEAKREKWTETEIAVDHPIRKAQFIRDPTVFTAGLTTTITGLHCDISILDDVVVADNAYTEDGRNKTRDQAGYLASIAGTEAKLWAVGTRYHPKDLYEDMMSQVVVVPGSNGEVANSYSLYEVWQKEVEDAGDGSGNFLWPRMKSRNGKYYGFDKEQLAIKKAQYPDVTQFKAQYYNDPNDLSTASITPDMFQYYERNKLSRDSGKWYYNGSRLNIAAAVDFAYSDRAKADYTAIVVVGVDSKHNYYVLDIDRFKTTKISDYFDRILRLHTKWDFRKLRAETTAAQAVIVKELKENYIRPHGLSLVIDDVRPTRHEGSKEERIEAVLQPKYANRQVYHFAGGNCSYLEEELIYQNPSHDDIKDSLAYAIDCSVTPSHQVAFTEKKTLEKYYNPRFGGIG